VEAYRRNFLPATNNDAREGARGALDLHRLHTTRAILRNDALGGGLKRAVAGGLAPAR